MMQQRGDFAPPANIRNARKEFQIAASKFRNALSPYLIRRDKRQDPDVASFHEKDRIIDNSYRRESEIVVDAVGLTVEWQRAICAAESLSLVSSECAHSTAKRLRLTVATGMGIAAVWISSGQRMKTS